MIHHSLLFGERLKTVYPLHFKYANDAAAAAAVASDINPAAVDPPPPPSPCSADLVCIATAAGRPLAVVVVATAPSTGKSVSRARKLFVLCLIAPAISASSCCSRRSRH